MKSVHQQQQKSDGCRGLLRTEKLFLNCSRRWRSVQPPARRTLLLQIATACTFSTPKGSCQRVRAWQLQPQQVLHPFPAPDPM